MVEELKILLVAASDQQISSLVDIMQKGGFQPNSQVVSSLKEFKAALHREEWDIILSAHKFPRYHITDALEYLSTQAMDIPVIVITGAVSEREAVTAMKAGVCDIVLLQELKRLPATISEELRKAAERRLERRIRAAQEQNERTFKILLENAPLALVIVNKNAKVIYVNQKTEILFGYPKAELFGQPVKRIIPNYFINTSEELSPELARQFASQAFGVSIELEGLKKDGRTFDVECSSAFVETERGFVIINFIHDITVRKRAEEQIREQATMLDNASEAIIVMSMDNRIVYWNQGAAQVYGYSSEEAMGKPAREILFNRPSVALMKAQKDVLKKGSWQGELRLYRKDGSEVTVLSRLSLIRTEEGEPKSILIIAQDITERKSLESQFLRAQRMENIGTLAGGIAHDLNNMLSPILVSIQMLRMKKLGEEQQQRVLDTIERSATRGAELVRQVLTFARGAEGERNILQPRYVIQEVARIADETFPKSIFVEHSLAKDLWNIFGDTTQFQQVLMNLCINARDAMSGGGRLFIEAGNVRLTEPLRLRNEILAPGAYVAISVKDSGVGIPEELLEKIFDPFFTTKDIGKGTGLGLSTALAIVKNHGGGIYLSSQPGKGSIFRIYFPAMETPSEPDSGKTTEQIPEGRGELVLVVDDEASVRDITRQTLESFGYRVVTAADGLEALQAFEQHQSELQMILLDLVMPLQDGKVTLSKLRQKDPNIKVIAVSGFVEDDSETELKKLGADEFLVKPFSAGRLLSSIRNLIERKTVK